MNIESLREYCLSLPGVTEQIQWGNDLLFKVGGKMFVAVGLGSEHGPSFKCTPETFAELTARDSIEPAAYVGRYGWVSPEKMNTIKDAELRELIALIKSGKRIALLCYCRDPKTCHRSRIVRNVQNKLAVKVTDLIPPLF